MIRIDRRGVIKNDPEDIFKYPDEFIDINWYTNKVYFKRKWGAVLYFPKEALSYLDKQLNYFIKTPTKNFDYVTVIFLVQAASRAYAASSRRYKSKRISILTTFSVIDIYHMAVEEYLSLLKEGLEQNEVMKYERDANGNYINKVEARVITRLLRFLVDSRCFERPFGDLILLDSFVEDEKEGGDEY